MFEYLVILLDEASASFCHYEAPSLQERKPISADMLKQGIRFAMRQNLAIQFVYPHYEISDELDELVHSVDHFKIMPADIDATKADVVVVDGFNFDAAIRLQKPTTLRVKKDEFFARYHELVPLLEAVPNVNVVFTDVQHFTAADLQTYSTVISLLAEEVAKMYVGDLCPRINLLTDRLSLNEMNNCGAGATSLTMAPNGNLYACPGFYYDDPENCVGNINQRELEIPNGYLYTLASAPICRHCDAWHCKRCVWLNRKTTLEVNTPSHEQCVMAHLERNASGKMLMQIREHGSFMPECEIEEIDYLDPFDKRHLW
ncbi:MAG: CXXX repeat peptide maturase [Muribaculaceae bacterium]|nr:CXXX repeat peptide maturase [Muribaculaceae bacterium]